MDSSLYLDSISSHGQRMSGAAALAGLDSPVPTCPDWTVRDLIVHTGVVHRHKTETIRGDYRNEAAEVPRPPASDVSDDEFLSWFDAGVAQLLDVSMSADLTDPSWTWCAHDHNKDWWVRRMAHETAIHSIDAVIASGQQPMVESLLALDGVAEVLDEFMVGGPTWGVVVPTDRVIRLETPGRSWTLRTGEFSGTSPDTGTTYTRLAAFVYDDEAVPMATVATDEVTLDLWLWGRGELPDAAFTGDRALVDHVRSVAAEATA
ncbi:MAG: maleylpyruvate isomerase family mycothiol-dependent enzyme [Acidimicrobiia bacterium]|nr:MAG: maleylpyruvate isomerase family mycothiol-dependent enzyme [Acidimicrobiia bacterium]